MRLDYVLYAIAVIFFVITVSAVAFSVEQQQVWIVSTVVIGLAFIGAGYTQRPRSTVAPTTTIAPEQSPSPPQPQQQPLVVTTAPPTELTVTEPVKIEEVKPIVEQPQVLTSELMKVKGIGGKRTTQLKALGINTIEDLGNASPKDLAAKLSISPKITSKWVANAKEIKQAS
jgi:predicted flap endonuclease-1-like 5' DNA nuclease